MLVFEDGGNLGLDDIMRVDPHDGINGFIRRGRKWKYTLFSMQGHSEKLAICEPLRELSIGPNLAKLELGLPSLQDYKTYTSVV